MMTTTKPSPMQYAKKPNGQLAVNSQSILPRTLPNTYEQKVRAHNNNNNYITSHPNGNTELNYSTVKCQNNAKNQSAYAKALANTIKTTMSHPTKPPPPSSYAAPCVRITKFNSCKHCMVRDTDEMNARRTSAAGVVPMPKLKCDMMRSTTAATAAAALMDSTSTTTDSDKMPMDAKRQSAAIISAATMRRSSIDTYNIYRKSAFRQSLDDEYSYANARRQSLDDNVFKAPQTTVAKSYQSHNGGGSNIDYHVTRAANGIGDSDINRKLIKQRSLDEYGDATARLRKLEMKMRKHTKINVLQYVNGNGKQLNGGSVTSGNQRGKTTDTRNMLNYQLVNGGAQKMKVDSFGRVRSDCVYPKISVENAVHGKGPQTRRMTTNGSYGIITASELHKLRTSAERIT